MSTTTHTTPTTASTAPTTTGGVPTGLVALTVSTVTLMVLIGEVIPPVIVFDLVFLALAVGLRRSSHGGLRWAATILPALLVLINAPYALADLQHPASPGGFIPTVAVVATGVTTAVLGVLLLRGRPASGRGVWTVVAGVVLLAGIGSVVASAGVEDAVGQAGDVAVAAEDFTYPDEVTVDAGGALLVSNGDGSHHTFTVEGTPIDVDVPAASTARVVVDLAPGTYTYLCAVIGHEAMTGTLVVE